jgi:3-mercaptopyruvate sulfurtransferase SseA
MSRNKVTWILLLAVAALAACQATPTAPVATQPGTGERLPQTREEVPRIRLEELRGLLASSRRLVVIDTRSRAEYEAAHIPGAISIPYTEVETRYEELPRTTPIVTYCA